MLLKLGATMMAAALAVAAGVALTVLLRSPESPAAAEPALVPEETEATADDDFGSYEEFSRAELKPRPRPESNPAAEPEPATEPKPSA